MLTVSVITTTILGMLFAASDPPQYSVRNSQRAAPENSLFLAGYAVEKNGAWAVEFFRASGQPDSILATRSLLTPRGREQGVQVSSDACHAVSEAVTALSDLPSTDIRIAGVSPFSSLRAPPGPVSSGASYHVWGNGRQADGAFAQISVSANAGLLADIVQRIDDRLKSCWPED